MPSAWKSPNACRALGFTVAAVAIALTAASSTGAETHAGVEPRAGAETRLVAETRAWTPLADLYAARQLEGDPLAHAVQPPPEAEPQAAAATEEGAPGSKNPRRALLLSLLLPGAGELYLGHKGRAAGFFVTEGAVWAHFAAWEIAAHLRKNDYIEQARLNAGVGVDSESDDYWRLVGTYIRSSGTGPDSYEEALRRDARLEHPDDPAAQDAYVAERLPTEERAWDWGTGALQGSYVSTRQNASRAFNRAKFSFALAILNRIASAIDTQILHRSDMRSRRSSLDSGEPRLLATVTADGGGRVLVRHRF